MFKQWDVTSANGSRGECLENYRCVGGCQKLNTSKKAVYVTKVI